MTDLELLEILERPASNLEKALAIRTLLKVAQPSAHDLLNGAGHEGPTQ